MMMVRSNNYRLKGVLEDLEEALGFISNSLLKKLKKEVNEFENVSFKGN